MRSRYPMKPRKRTCSDCGKEYESCAANAKRCADCRNPNGSPKKRTPRAKEQSEPVPTCTLCGKPMSVVRPGKYECYREQCQIVNAKEQR